MKLYLDNERPAPDGWHLVRTVDEAKAFLRHKDIEQLSLDYDLDGDHKGFELLEWMKSSHRWPKYLPKVHSGNVVGALKMKAFIAEHAPDLERAPAVKKGRPPGKRSAGKAYATALAPGRAPRY